MLAKMWNNQNSQTFIGDSVKWYNLFRKKVWKCFIKLNIYLPYDPAIPILGI